jgi:large subunit ribosomal protein L22
MVTATLTNHRQSPRKVRRVANLIKGKPIATAVSCLMFTPKYAADPILKLLKSAIANAKSLSVDDTNLIVKGITVDKGPILKRMMPMARGRGFPIHKHTSTITITLDVKAPKIKKNAKAEKVAEVKAEAKPAKVVKAKAIKK